MWRAREGRAEAAVPQPFVAKGMKRMNELTPPIRLNRLPSGTVTFLFTDVESSTRLLREHQDAYPQVLANHRRVLREVFGRYGGVEVDTQGDALFIAFPRASDAVAAAEEGQRALATGPVRVRMGIHTGEPVLTPEGYIGIDVHRAARIAAAGHGGQVLISHSTHDLTGRDDLRDLGVHRLKDLSTPERIYQLGNGDFPPLRTQFATNLPVPLTPFIGRLREVTAARALLARDGVRLVTLTGAGGSGKTRLAIQVATDAAEDYEDGVWWVSLAALTKSEDVMPVVGRTVGGGSAAEAVGNRRLLILLDNFEHVIAAAPEVATLLAVCPRLDVLITSRERLSLQGEHIYPVPVLTRSESRELFVSRARAVAPTFEPDRRLDELCARLDDLPLAIELAAARTSLMTEEQLLARLGSRLDLLHAGRDAEQRHQTLRATIEWSYELLNPDEQRLLTALSVFRSAWTLESTERVAGSRLEPLQSLIDKSLISRLLSGRFTMLDTVRDFAAERLDPRERDRFLRQLLEYQLDLFATASLSEDPVGPPQMDLANAERPNMDAALAWAAVSGSAEKALRLLLLTEMYWITTDPVGCRERLDGLMAKVTETNGSLNLGLHARVLRLRGATLDLTNTYDLSELEFARAIELFRAAGENDQIGPLMARIANCALRQGDVERAIPLATQSLEIVRRRGDPADVGYALFVLAMAAFQQGDVEKGTQLAHESAPLTLRGGFPWISGTSLLATAEHLIAAGQLDRAEHDLNEGLETLASVSDRINIPYALAAAAAIAALRRLAVRSGMLWGALEALAEREPRSTTQEAMRDNTPYLRGVQGDDFEKGRELGRGLSLDEAVERALSHES